jgi:hypothetical protein
LGILQLNDRGLDGDQSIGDDVYTSTLHVTGLEVGEYSVNITATDSFGSVSTKQGSITVVNQAPRLLSVEFAPSSLERGQSTVVNARAYDGHGVSKVQLDLRPYEGTLVDLTATDGVWTAMVPLPLGFSPGVQTVTMVVEDGLGASERYQRFTQGEIGDAVKGPHHVDVAFENPIEIEVLNDRPVMEVLAITVEKKPDESAVFTVAVTDPDGIERVQIDLGVYAPIGQSSWIAMHDDGRSGGDLTAGDGVYSVLLSIRDGTPLGTHEVSVRSFDAYGEMNTTSVAIQLVDASGPIEEGPASTTVLVTVLGGLLVLGALLVLGLMNRRQGGQDGESVDRFGTQ